MRNSERLKQIDGYPRGGDYQKLRSQYVYCSEALSGSRLSEEETGRFLADGHMSRTMTEEDVRRLIGHGLAFDAMLQLAQGHVAVTEELLKELYRSLLHEGEAGPEYRRDALADPYAAAPEDIAQLMRHLIDQMRSSVYLHPIEYAAMCHKRLMDIQPWPFDNDKMARLLMSYVLINAGLPPALIGPERKERYQKALRQLQSRYDMDPFIELLADTVLDTLRQMHDDTLPQTNDDTLRQTNDDTLRQTHDDTPHQTHDGKEV